MNAFDDRIFELTISLAGEIIAQYDQSFYIIATGTKYTNGNFGECALRIDNISKIIRDYIITQTTPWANPRQNAQITLNVGRESYGTFQIFQGDMIGCNVTQPPDIGLTFRSCSGAATIGYANAVSSPSSASLLSICQQVADNLSAASPQPVILDFQSTQGDKSIGNYTFSGPVTNQVNKLATLADITAHVDNGKLTILDIGTPRVAVPIEVNSQTGMIGVPEITEVGVRVKMLIQNDILLGSPVTVQSVLNPSANGNFYVYQLSFEVASRDTPFYWIMDLRPTLIGNSPS